MIDERRAKPLQLRSINFLNTTKTGTALSGATDSFNVSKVLFVGWQVSFENRLYKLEPGQYRVDAAYIGPDGRTLGSVNDFQPVSTNMKTVTFSGRVGNSRGGAFLPGTYTVNFYLNGQYFDAKKFEVVADAGPVRMRRYPGSGGGGAIGSTMGAARPRRAACSDRRSRPALSAVFAAAAIPRWICGCVRSPTASCMASW